MKRYEELYDVLNKELQPALGCTEPAAVTYACAVAAKALGVPAEKVEIAASKIFSRMLWGWGFPIRTAMESLPRRLWAYSLQILIKN